MKKWNKKITLIAIIIIIISSLIGICFKLKNKQNLSKYANFVDIHAESAIVQNITMKVGETRNLTIKGDGRARIWYFAESEDNNQKKIEIKYGDKEWLETYTYYFYYRKTFQMKAISKGNIQIIIDWDPRPVYGKPVYLGWIENQNKKIINIDII